MSIRDLLLTETGLVASPALLIYRDRVERNTARALEIAGGTERLRPHVKTHKSADVLAIQMAAGIHKFKCATPAEAQMLAAGGVKDVLLAYPLVGPAVALVVQLAKAYPETTFGVLADNTTAVESLSATAAEAGVEMDVLLDLDTGMHRTGIAPGPAAVALYRRIATLPGLRPAGIHAYDGHNHQKDPGERCLEAEKTRRAAKDLAAELTSAGLPVPRLVLGGTPTFPCHAVDPDVELSPGTCFLHDGNYLRDHPDLPFEAAALLLARVISVPTGDTITLDLGHKAIAADPAGPRGFLVALQSAEGVVRETAAGDALTEGLSGARPLGQSEEHWVFGLPRAAERASVGDLAYVLPAHICPTVNLQERLFVVGTDRAVETTWPVTARTRAVSV